MHHNILDMERPDVIRLFSCDRKLRQLQIRRGKRFRRRFPKQGTKGNKNPRVYKTRDKVYAYIKCVRRGTIIMYRKNPAAWVVDELPLQAAFQK